MNNVTPVTNDTRIFALLLSAVIGLVTTTSHASEAEKVYDNITASEQVSAYGAKRLARRFLSNRGFVYGVGPGAARIKSITRDGDTWVLHVVFSQDSRIMHESALLYIDAGTARVSEVAPLQAPRHAAAQ